MEDRERAYTGRRRRQNDRERPLLSRRRTRSAQLRGAEIHLSATSHVPYNQYSTETENPTGMSPGNVGSFDVCDRSRTTIVPSSGRPNVGQGTTGGTGTENRPDGRERTEQRAVRLSNELLAIASRAMPTTAAHRRRLRNRIRWLRRRSPSRSDDHELRFRAGNGVQAGRAAPHETDLIVSST